MVGNMSRFVDKLKRLHQTEPQPMGFMLNRVATEKPRLQVVALVAAESLEKVSEGLKSADAAVIEINKSEDIETLGKVCQVGDDVPGGGWLKAAKGGILKKATESACDFVVFTSAAPIALTQKDKMGRILEIDITLSEGLLRTVNDLPVDAVLVSGKSEDISFTLNRVMFIQRLCYLVNKPILVSISDNATEADLQVLWDMGISGVVVETSNEKSVEKLAELRGIIGKLNSTAFRKKSRVNPILPRLQAETSQPQEGGGEEEEEDE
jgi:hypothetical protein